MNNRNIEIVLDQEYLESGDNNLQIYNHGDDTPNNASIVYIDEQKEHDEVIESVNSLKRVYQVDIDPPPLDPIPLEQTPEEVLQPQQTTIVHSSPIIIDSYHTGVKYQSETDVAIIHPPLTGSFQVLDLSGQVLDTIEIDEHSNKRRKMDCLVQEPGLTQFPSWSRGLKECEQIGESIRGWIRNEGDLLMILSNHRTITNSIWGTRQSPNSAKLSSRLMWKSQYIPFDGIPFINAGSRAVVMECKFGPRRRGIRIGYKNSQATKLAPSNCDSFQTTCPARIYVKKVIKFISHRVQVMTDKKLMKIQMDKAFRELKCKLDDNQEEIVNGESRYYVQLPTEKAHEFHDNADNLLEDYEETINEEDITTCIEEAQCIEAEEVTLEIADHVMASDHLDHRVQEKICEYVASGESNTYVIRKRLRKFVDDELLITPKPKKHDKDFYPTVNDLQNRIHLALRDMQDGSILSVEQSMMKVRLETLDKKKTDELFKDVADINLTLTKNVMNEECENTKILSKVELVYRDGSKHVVNNITKYVVKRLDILMPGVLPTNCMIKSPSDDIAKNFDYDLKELKNMDEEINLDENIYNCDMTYDKNQYIYANGEDETFCYNSLYNNVEVVDDTEDEITHNETHFNNEQEVTKLDVCNEDYEYIT